MTLTVRSATVTGATTKGSALSHPEMDANWAHVIQSSNQSFLPSGTGAIAETVESRGRWIVNVTDFISDADRASLRAGGTVDITTAAHAARDRVGTGIILFQAVAGIYSTSGITASVANQEWHLERGATLKLTANAAANIGVIWARANGVKVTGHGVIDGNQANQTNTGIDGVRFSENTGAAPTTGSITDGAVQDVTIQNCTTAGVSMFRAARMRVERVLAVDTLLYGVRARNLCTDVLIQGCIATKATRGSGSTGFQIDGISDVAGTTTCSRIRVVDCIAKTWESAGIYLNGTVDGVVIGCHAEDCGDIGIDFEFTKYCAAIGCTAYNNVNMGIATFQENDYVTISGCEARGTTDTTNGHGFYSNTSDHVVITGCVADANKGNGIYVVSGNYCNVNGNTVTAPAAAQNAGGTCVTLLACASCTVNGNAVDGAYNHGILLNVVTYSVIDGNISKNNGQGQANAAGLHVAGNSTHNTINGNVCVDDRGGSAEQAYGITIAAAGDSPNTVTNNVLNLGNVTAGLNDNGTATNKRGNRYSATGALQGTAVLVNGEVVVSTIEIRTADRVLLTRVVPGGTTRGLLTVFSITNATSFTIRGEDLTGTQSTDDDSTVFWEIVH